MADPVEVLTSPVLGSAPHGFLGRRGGVSEGVMWGLNVGTGSEDDPVHLAENRRRACAAVLPGAELVMVYQIHSAHVATVTEPWSHAARPQADALVTNRPGVLLGILTADCAPVLFHDPVAGVVGAAHAGWRGALAGVTDNTIAAMEALGASRNNIAAAIGPCIAQPSYEVDAAFEANFVVSDTYNARFFQSGREGHAWFDLEGYLAARVAVEGIIQIGKLGEDTYTQEDRFYSFRRATHRAEPSYGRQVSLIGLP